MDRRAEKLEYESEQVVLETARLAMSIICDVREITESGDVVVFPSDTWSDHTAKAVSEVTVHKTEHYGKDGGLRSISTRTNVKMHPKQAALALLSQQLGIIGKAAKQRPVCLEDMGICILPTLDEEPDWERIEDGDPRYSLVRPPSDDGDE